MVFDAFREKSMNVSVGGCLKQNMASRRERKREKVRVGPGLRECEAGYKTNNCRELRVSGEGYMHRRGGAEHERVKVVFCKHNLTDTRQRERWGVQD